MASTVIERSHRAASYRLSRHERFNRARPASQSTQVDFTRCWCSFNCRPNWYEELVLLMFNGSIHGRLESAIDVAATDVKTTCGAPFVQLDRSSSRSSSLTGLDWTGSRSTSASLSAYGSAEGLRGLQASRRRSTSQNVGAVSTANLTGTRNLSF